MSISRTLTDLPGSERLVSFAQYGGDLGVGLAKQFDSRARLMCAVNEYDHYGFVPTPDSIRQGMTSLIAAGCDQILVFGGYPVFDDPTHVFGTQSVVDAAGSPTDFAAATQEGSGHSSLVALRPQRLLETRVGTGLGTVDGQFNGQGLRPPDSVLALGVVGRADVPDWARSVVLNVTVTGATGPGFLTVYPCGQPQPWSSNLNYDIGVTRAVTVVAQLGGAGDVCVYTRAAAHVVVDLTGYFPSGASFAGAQPARTLETRIGAEFTTVDGQSVGLGRLAGGAVTPITVAGRADVPADAKAVAVNLTIIGPALDGFATLYPCGDPIPLASTLNFTRGVIVSNAAIVEVGDSGSICLFSNVEIDAVVDVNGYDAATSVVQFMTPTRLLETRSRAGHGRPPVPGSRAPPGGLGAGAADRRPARRPDRDPRRGAEHHRHRHPVRRVHHRLPVRWPATRRLDAQLRGRRHRRQPRRRHDHRRRQGVRLRAAGDRPGGRPQRLPHLMPARGVVEWLRGPDDAAVSDRSGLPSTT